MRIFTVFVFIQLFLGVGTCQWAMAQVILPENGAETTVSNFQILRGDSLEVELEAVLKEPFEPVSKPINFGVSEEKFWLKIDFENDSDIRHWRLQLLNPSLDSVTAYVLDNVSGQWKKSMQGDHLRYTSGAERFRYPVVPFELSKGHSTSVYLLIKARGSIQIPIRVSAQHVFSNTSIIENLFFGFFYGVIIIMVLYNLFLYFSTNFKPYWLYVCYLFLFALAHFSLNGQLKQFFDASPLFFKQEWILFNIILGNFFVTWFGFEFIEVKKYSKFWSKVLTVYMVVALVCTPGTFFVDYLWMIRIISGLSVIGTIMLIVSGIHIYLLGNKNARMYILGWSILFTGLTMFNLWMNGFLEGSLWIRYINQVGAIFEILILSIALSDRINILKFEKKEAIQQSLVLAVKNKDLVVEQNELLEEKVLNRTKEIKQQNAQIENQNKALERQQERLEETVNSRTIALKETNKELVQYNTRLQQFSFIVAHNFKAPIARLLGLTSIFDPDNIDFKHNQAVLTKVNQEANELNSIIKDLNLIIDLQKGKESAITKFNFQELMDGVQQQLEEEIKRSGATIEFKCSLTTTKSVKAYWESILYNLISNAIKYRSAKPPIIHVELYPTQQYLNLVVKDNGLGFELEKVEGKMFQPYQRFNENIQGKGLGLFLVKTQVELLHGKIKVYSKRGVGSMFRMQLKI